MQGSLNFNLPSQHLKLENIPLFSIFIVGLFILKFLVDCIYNIYFHPLRKFPGPNYAAATGLPYAYLGLTGNECRWLRQLHQKYGEVVRLAPDRISYIKPEAWKDIYGHRIGGRLENPKDARFTGTAENGEHTVISLIDANEHGRFRKIFTNAFSDKSLRLQEPLIRGYVNKLIENIHRTISTNPAQHFNIVRLFNFTTFDIMGDLAFGESLGMLEKSQYTPWVSAIFGNIRFINIDRFSKEYPKFRSLLKAVQPKYMAELRQSHLNHTIERVDRRLEKGVDIGKPDIWKLVLEKGKDLLTIPSMHAHASLFMIAGTETTATLLSGLTFLLLRNPEKMRKLLEEVRTLPEEELSLVVLPKLPYLNACFEEALRCYPPVPCGIPRQVAQGGNVICGEWVPEGTRVVVPQHAAYYSATNFKNPDSFIPERWLPNTGYDGDRKDVLQPFSFGPRNCLGKNLAYHEMRIIFATLLWHFDLELCSESSSWLDQKTYVLWEKPELMVTIKARSID